MNTRLWILRSLRFHRNQHLAVAGGTALATAVLAAALLAGDALNRELRRTALERVGAIRSAVELQGRLIDVTLADRLAHETGARVAPVLQLPAAFLTLDGDEERRIDRVHAYGVDDRFLALTLTPARRSQPDAGTAWLSRSLADALGATPSDGALRFAPPTHLPFDMPLGDHRSARTVRRPVQVRGVQDDADGGRFSLLTDQIPPLNAFVAREWLATAADARQRANLLLSDAEPAVLEAALRRALLPGDVGVNLTRAPDGLWLVRSDRVFLDDAHAQALSSLTPTPVLALHHLADAFAAGAGAAARETPYGFISALTPSVDPRLGVVPASMADDEVVINAWLAEKLRIGIGDHLTLRWRRFESGGRLTPDETTLRVVQVIDMPTAAAERERLPLFPGLTSVERCADWDIGLPLEQAKLADPDNEAYWKLYGPTPKAFVTLAAGRLMLGTHLGGAMVARVPPETTAAAITNALRRVDPRALGLTARAVRQEALQAVAQATDFRVLFTGMAVVLMVAALILTALLASLGVTRRRGEIGILRAAGFTPHAVAGLWVAESLPALLVGVVAGLVLGLGGAWLLVAALNHVWSGALAATHVTFSIGIASGLVAVLLALVASLLAVWCSVRRVSRETLRTLLADAPGGETSLPERARAAIRRAFALGMGAAAAALGLLVAGIRLSGAEAAAGLFFGAGLLLMISLLCLARLLVHFLECRSTHPTCGPIRAGVLNIIRHPRRSLLVMVLLATGSFLSVGVLAMKQDPAADARKRSSGSGGFDWMVETALPSPDMQVDDILRHTLGATARLLPFRVHAGDEAGCLNLNQARQPRLLGVDPDGAAALQAFDGSSGGPSVWSLLQHPMSDGTLPALAGDQTTVTYGLHTVADLRTGGVFSYTGEDGTIWNLRVVGALPVRTGVLQGSLIVDEDLFTRLYPSAPGHGLWLARGEQTNGGGDALADALRHNLGRNGALVTPTRARLHALGAVESSYLDMFLILGGLGMTLGAAGTGLVVWRNVLARRRELAVLRAVGIPSSRLLAYLLAEHLYLLLAGLGAGTLSALVSVQPAMRTLHAEMPVQAMAAMIAAMLIAGFIGILAAVRAASRTELLQALRGE